MADCYLLNIMTTDAMGFVETLRFLITLMDITPLTRAQAKRVAMMAHDGLARCIRPIHTPFDGDAIFVISVAETGVSDAVAVAEIGTVAADLVMRAVRRGVFG